MSQAAPAAANPSTIRLLGYRLGPGSQQLELPAIVEEHLEAACGELEPFVL